MIAASYLVPNPQPGALATLYFPPARPVDWRHPGDGEVRQAPCEWARSLLSSAQAGEQIRGAINSEVSPEAAAASSLLGEGEHLRVELREPGLLEIKVTFDRPEVSLLVCQSLLAYLEQEVLRERGRRVESGLGALVREQADALEKQERAEADIVRQLRLYKRKPTAGDADVGLVTVHPDPVDALAKEDFQVGLAATRRLRSRELRLALEEETSLPGFSVMDPPHLNPLGRPTWYTPMAALLGLMLAARNLIWRGSTKGRAHG